MNIVILNTTAKSGGAARAAYRLHKGFLNMNLNSVYLVKNEISKTENIYKLYDDYNDGKIENFIQANGIDLNRSSITNTYFSFNYENVSILDNRFIRNSDIVNLHWIDKFISENILMQLVRMNKKIVWTLHDEKPYTGGCHYTSNCKEFYNNCSNCIQLNQNINFLPSRVLHFKKEILKYADISIITPSQWLKNEAQKSSLFKHCRIECIPNSLELDIFKPYEKKFIREKFNIAIDNFVIMIGAANNKIKRKGFDYFLKSIEKCLENKSFYQKCLDGKIHIITIGVVDERIYKLPIKIKNFGVIKEDKILAEIYNISDIFILPSIEDNLPNTMLESMSCGVPVIAFDIGGVPDVIINNENGYIVPSGNIVEMARKILFCSENINILKKFGDNAVELMQRKFKIEDQASNYRNFFEELIDKKNSTKFNLSLKHLPKNNRYDDIIGGIVRVKYDDFFRHKNAKKKYLRIFKKIKNSIVKYIKFK